EYGNKASSTHASLLRIKFSPQHLLTVHSLSFTCDFRSNNEQLDFPSLALFDFYTNIDELLVSCINNSQG
ncbi:hypothetical protein, partial [Vibrio splendidus]|uniref:hypothetical protein n=1 Tax=Vibrio splendidus TaxID=29497 RepID=UPI001A7E1BA8